MSETKSRFTIVLVAPEIPGNTGSIGRTCVALNAELVLIKPYGFEIDEKAVRRAGLDYWKYVQIREFESFEDFLIKEKPSRDKMFFFENNGYTFRINIRHFDKCRNINHALCDFNFT